MNRTILLADDSVTIRKVVELTFMDEDFELISVGDGDAALERFEEDSGIDLVIADVHMPGADGYEVCKAVKSQSRIPVLLLVGTFEKYDEDAATNAGADGHLKKPFDSQDLLGRVHQLLGGAESGVKTVEPEIAKKTEMADGASLQDTQEIFGTVGAVDAVDAEDADQPQALPESVGEVPGTVVDAVENTDDEKQADPTPAPSDSATGELNLSEESIHRIARRVVELLSEDALREVAWEVIPDLAEVVIKERLQELESQVE